MDLKNIYDEILENEYQELITNRRIIHGFAETGFDLPQTVAFVEKKLREYGYEPERRGKSGITCVAGKGGKVVLLRGDMDALPMAEESGLEFASVNGNCHSCGHDTHTAMLLCAAKYIKLHEKELPGTVKFMFQPAEELLAGALDMISAGILENPKVDYGLGIHIIPGLENTSSGKVLYIPGCMANSGDAIKIEVEGVGGHGSHPQLCIDSNNIAARIILALDELVARELPMNSEAIVVVGKVSGGTTINSISGKTVLEVSSRAADNETRDYLLKRIREIACGIAETFRGKATVEHLYGVPPFNNDKRVLAACVDALTENLPAGYVEESERVGGTEDFTEVSNRVPSAFLFIGAGSVDEGFVHSVHHPEMIIDEKCLASGVAAHIICGMTLMQN